MKIKIPINTSMCKRICDLFFKVQNNSKSTLNKARKTKIENKYAIIDDNF